MIGIYKVTNKLDGKCYIGQSKNIEKRFKAHKKDYRSKRIVRLYNAIDKYGVENFEFEVLEECSIEMLNDLEKKYIAKYKSNDENFGYNIGEGGIGYTGTPNEETLKKRSHALKGKKKPKSWCEKMSKIHKGKVVSEETKRKISNALKGNKLSKETKEKLRIASTGKTHSKDARKKISERVSKRVYMFSLEGELIGEFPNARTATKETGISFSNISSCCNGARNKAGGYKWSFNSRLEE